ncbi:MAG: hypothetical protein HY231_11015 [Acidobacteria bacterium]|nr:hypothetical protein [Acidobacteriota bacterium]
MKAITFIFFIFILPFQNFAVQDIKIPEGVRYKPASDELNQQTKAKLESLLSAKVSDAEIDRLFNDAIICAPGLWQYLANEKKLEGKKLINNRPLRNAKGEIYAMIKEEGRFFQIKEQVRLFWRIFLQKFITDKPYVIRKATAPEIKYFWTTIPFDIEEPLFVLDTTQTKFIVEFSNNKNGETKILWIDTANDL